MNLSTVPLSACSPSAISAPVVFGAEILSLSASWVSNFTLYVPAEFNYNHGDVAVNNAEFCNITVAYTHPGTGDHITVETWLPRTGWNERLQATGGGGWQAGRWLLSEFFMAGAIGEGYATTTTDGGLGDATTPDTWALISPGNVDLYTLRDFGYKALEDQAIIGKSLVKSFYGREPAYSYWSGCSQGGRQGLMLAQRYPTAYDGIAASAPAQSWTQLISSTVYPGLLTNWIGEYALACELDFLTEKAIADCDPKDGIVDGIISDMDVCDFNPFSMVNESFHCASTGKTMKLSQAGAVVADAVWGGPRSADGKFLWYGMNYGANISSYGLASPNSSTQNQDDLWFRWFMEMNPDYNASTMTHEQFDWFFHLAIDMYTDVLGANDPDLTAFQKAGGKLISYHGMVIRFLSFFLSFFNICE